MLFFRGAPCLSAFSLVSLPARRLLAWVPHSSRALFAREGWGAYTAVVRSRYFAIAAAISALDLATDFLDFYYGVHHWHTFNLGDSAIVCGAILLAWDALFAKARRQKSG